MSSTNTQTFTNVLLPPPIYLRSVCSSLAEYESGAQYLLSESQACFSEFQVFLQYVSSSLLPQLTTLSFCPLQVTGEETLLSCAVPCCRFVNNKDLHSLNVNLPFQNHHVLILDLIKKDAEACLVFLEEKTKEFQHIPSCISVHPSFSKAQYATESLSTREQVEDMKQKVTNQFLQIQNESSKLSVDSAISMRLTVLDQRFKSYFNTWTEMIRRRKEEHQKMNKNTIESIRSICSEFKTSFLYSLLPDLTLFLQKRQEEEEKIHLLFETNEKSRIHTEKTDFYKKVSEWISSQKKACEQIIAIFDSLLKEPVKTFSSSSSSSSSENKEKEKEKEKDIQLVDPSFSISVPPVQLHSYPDSHSSFTVTSKFRKELEWKETPMFNSKIDIRIFESLKQSQESQLKYLTEALSIWSRKLTMTFKHPLVHIAALKQGWSELMIWIQCVQMLFVSLSKEKALEIQAFSSSSNSTTTTNHNHNKDPLIQFLFIRQEEGRRNIQKLSIELQNIQTAFQSTQQSIQQLNQQRENQLFTSKNAPQTIKQQTEQIFDLEASIRNFNAKAKVYNFELNKLQAHLAQEKEVFQKIQVAIAFLNDFQSTTKTQWDFFIRNEEMLIRKWKDTQEKYQMNYIQHRQQTNAWLQSKMSDYVSSVNQIIQEEMETMSRQRNELMESLDHFFQEQNEFLVKIISSTDTIFAEVTLSIQHLSSLIQTYQQDLQALILHTDLLDVKEFEEGQKSLVLLFWCCLCQITHEMLQAEELKTFCQWMDTVCTEKRKLGFGLPFLEDPETNHPNQSSSVSQLVKFIYEQKMNKSGDVYLSSSEKKRRQDVFTLNSQWNKLQTNLLKKI